MDSTLQETLVLFLNIKIAMMVAPFIAILVVLLVGGVATCHEHFVDWFRTKQYLVRHQNPWDRNSLKVLLKWNGQQWVHHCFFVNSNWWERLWIRKETW